VSTDRDVTRIVRSWMDEGVTQLPDRVLDLVLDQIPATPQRRASWLARRTPTLNTYARLGLVAAAVFLAAVVGIGLYARSGVGGPPPDASASFAPSLVPSPSTPVPDPMVGTWLAAEVTCEQQIATVEAAGFTADQMTLSGWTCPNGSTNRYSFQIGGGQDPRSLGIYDKGALAFPGSYHLVGGTTFEVLSQGGDYCLTYRYAIDGDQLTIVMTDHGCPTTGEAPLNDQVAQTAIFETSPFTRQP
jgi:hypothetical protein